MIPVLKKEWKSNFKTLTGWLFLAITLFFTGWYFKAYGLDEGYPYLSYIIGGLKLIFMFTFPLLTMRSFAEEKRYRTDQLLFTAPVSARAVVAGKYLAALMTFLTTVPLLLVFMFILSIYGDVPFKENVVAVIYFVLFGMACIGIGIFISALSDNQIIAAVLTFFVLMCSASVSGIVSSAGVKNEVLLKIFGLFDLARPFDNGMYGTLDLADPVYYISVTILMLYLTEFVLTSRRLHVKTSGFLNAATGVLRLVLVLAVMAGCNLAVRGLESGKRTIDMTYNKIRSLSEQAKEAIEGLSEDVMIYVYCNESEKDDTLDSTLSYMSAYNDRIKTVYIDPAANPQFYRQYSDREPSTGSLIVTAGDRSRVIEYADCYKLNYKYAYNAVSDTYVVSGYDVTGYDGEGKIVSAIDYVTDASLKKIYCIGGHDEAEVDTELKMRIENAHFELENINLLQYDEVPQDCSVLFLLGPLTDLTDDELGKLKKFTGRDAGAVLLCAYTDGTVQKNYDSLLAGLGIKVLDGTVYEVNEAYYNNEDSYLLPVIADTPWTQGIYTGDRTRYIYMPFAKGLKLTETPGAECRTFLSSSESARLNGTDEDEEGPFSLGVYVKKYLDKGSFRAAVISSDYFLDPGINRAVGGSNHNLFIKLLTSVAETGEVADIAVKNYEYDRILVPGGVRTVMGGFFMAVLPLMMIAVGMIIREIRKRK
ncbi:MAG: Gldg family protein [Lachnospiraceae bacterium]|nr:Gldg family protein [Lachnospiraceae bacterium]